MFCPFLEKKKGAYFNALPFVINEMAGDEYKDEEKAGNSEVNGREETNTINIGLSAQLLSNKSLNGTES